MSLFLQGKVSDPEPKANEPRTLAPPLIPTCTQSVCQEVHGSQMQGGSPRSDVLQGRPRDNMYLSKGGHCYWPADQCIYKNHQLTTPFVRHAQ